MEHIKPPPELDLITSDGNISERWRKWEQTMKLYLNMVMSDSDEKEQCSAFLYIIGQDGRDVYNTMTLEEGEADKIDVLFKKFKDYCQPSENTIVWRHRFNTKNQGKGESIDQFVTELRTLAKKCKFGQLCDELIRDRIVCGINNEKLKERLLRDGELTLVKAITVCRASEETTHMMKNLNHDEAAVASVNKKKMTKGHKQRPPHAYGSRNPQKHEKESLDTCGKCGMRHDKGKCPAYGKKCMKCHKLNHFMKCCRTKIQHTNKYNPRRGVNNINLEEECQDLDELFIGSVEKKEGKTKTEVRTDEVFVNMNIRNVPIKFKVDTGSQTNIIPLHFANKMKPKPTLCKPKAMLTSYTGDRIPVVGTTTLELKEQQVEFFVTDSRQVPLLGFKTSQDLGIIQVVLTTQLLPKNPTDAYPSVFKGLGCLGKPYRINLDTSVTPVVNPPRSIPATLREKLRTALDEMEQNKVIRKVDHPTEWVNSLVVVEKKMGKLRICLDPRNLNQAIKREHYQLPTIEEIMSRMSNAKVFSKLDANHGYWQVELDKESQELTTFNTPFGRYCYTRMPFGIKSAQEVFQKRVSQHFDDLKGVETDIDDILVWGESEAEHDKNLKHVLERCKDIGLTLNEEKCQFRVKEVTYIGHKLTATGIQPDPSKVEAIKNMPDPRDKKGVERLLGTVNYLAKFIPNMSETTEPMRKLLRSDIEFTWSTPQARSFKEIKQILSNSPVLAYFDVSRPVTVSCDASKSGLGAVILQDNKPIAYASRALTDAETRYAQIEKELLAVVFALERFNQYTYGKVVSVESDHKPLESILKKPLSQSPPRLQRMLLRLQRYDIDLHYKPGKELVVADTLSRAHLEKAEKDSFEKDVMYHVNSVMNNMPVTDDKMEEIRNATTRDESLQDLAKVILAGWPENRRETPERIHDFWQYRHELTIVDGIILRGTSIVIPKEMRSEMLEKIHIGHMGIEKSKKRARELLFWPGMANQIADMVAKCSTCVEGQVQNRKEPILQTNIPEGPWEVVGTDLFSWNHTDYVIATDYYSRFFEIAKLDNTRSTTVITSLKSFFARHGIPREVRSDNGPQYSCQEFKQFAKEWGFKHVTASPYHPQGNGLAEKSVQTVKRLLEKSLKDNKDPYLSLLEFRNTPTDTESPARLLMSRELRSIIPVTRDTLRPKVVDHRKIRTQRETTQDKQAEYYNKGSKQLTPLEPNDQIRFRYQDKWKPGNIINTHSPRSYVVQTPEGVVYRRNRRDIIQSKETKQEKDVDLYDTVLYDGIETKQDTMECKPPPVPPKLQPDARVSTPGTLITQPPSDNVIKTRSGRNVIRPKKYSDYV